VARRRPQNISVDPSAVTTVINLLDQTYGQEVVAGKIHEYLGMTLDYSKCGVVKIGMTAYVNKLSAEMPEDRDGTATSRDASYLFIIKDGIPDVDKMTAEFFPATVAKLLFLCKRGRPDIQTAIAFVCTRVQQPTVHDYNKLSHVIKYLRGTKDLVLRLSADNFNIAKWWVNVSYGVHHDIKSHTGGVMSMGTGAAYSTSEKQKLNTKSSTEAPELVGINDVLPQALWTKYFLDAQVYGTTTILNQDNQSTIKLADNGKVSSGRGTCHFNIRYFFITDQITRKEVAVQYYPTKEMVADYFTKPLQGVLFYKCRDQILGLVPMETIIGDHRSVLDQESKVAPHGTGDKSRKVRRLGGLHKNARIKIPVGLQADNPPQNRRSWAEVVKTSMAKQ
jgi:hypothetical protein